MVNAYIASYRETFTMTRAASLQNTNTKLCFLLVTFIAAILCNQTALSQEAYVPNELKPWIKWVKTPKPIESECLKMTLPRKQPTELCSWFYSSRFYLKSEGGHFEMKVKLEDRGDRKLGSPPSLIEVPLPGDRENWPQNVTYSSKNGSKQAVVLRKNSLPFTKLTPGEYKLRGDFKWSTLPTYLRVPNNRGIVSLNLNGQSVKRPLVDSAQRLWLQDTHNQSKALTRVLMLRRRFKDGNPSIIDTEIKISASEMTQFNISPARLTDTKLFQIAPEHPSRLDSEKNLLVQLKPGLQVVKFTSLFESAQDQVKILSKPKEWPSTEYWDMETNPLFRSVKISGGIQVGPQTVELPSSWRGLPIRALKAKEELQLSPRPSEINLAKARLELTRWSWLDLSSNTLFHRDRIGGQTSNLEQLTFSPKVSPAGTLISGTYQTIFKDSKDNLWLPLRTSTLNLLSESKQDTINWSWRGQISASSFQESLKGRTWKIILPLGSLPLHAWGPGEINGLWWQKLTPSLILLLIGAGTLTFLVSGGISAFSITLLQLTYPSIAASLTILVLSGICLALRKFRSLTPFGLNIILTFFALTHLYQTIYPEVTTPNLERHTTWTEVATHQGLSNQLPPQKVNYSNYSSYHHTAQNYLKLLNRISFVVAVLSLLGIFIRKHRAFLLKKILPVSLLTFFIGQLCLLYLPSRSTSSFSPRVTMDDNISRSRGLEMQSTRSSKSSYLGGQAGVSMDKELDGFEAPRAESLTTEIEPENHQVPPVGKPIRTWQGPQVSITSLGKINSDSHLNLVLLTKNRFIIIQLIPVILLGWTLFPLLSRARKELLFISLFIGPLCLTPLSAVKAEFPPKYLLDQLADKVNQQLSSPSEESDCTSECKNTDYLSVNINEDRILMRSKISALGRSFWRLPQPLSLTQIEINGSEAAITNSPLDGLPVLSLSRGVNEVTIEGLIPLNSEITVFEEPGKLDLQADDWSIQKGPGVLKLIPTTQKDNLHPTQEWFKLERTILIGQHWVVRSRLSPLNRQRKGETVIKLPLLSRELITTADRAVKQTKNFVKMRVFGNQPTIWQSQISPSSQITIPPLKGQPLSSTWQVECDSQHQCAPETAAPLIETRPGFWHWQPSPKDHLKVNVTELKGIGGSTKQLSYVDLTLKESTNQVNATWMLYYTTTLAQSEQITLPSGFELERIEVNGKSNQSREGSDSRVIVELNQGLNRVRITGRLPSSLGWFRALPQITPETPPAQVDYHYNQYRGKWIVANGGAPNHPIFLRPLLVTISLITTLLLGYIVPAPLALLTTASFGLFLVETIFILPVLVAIFISGSPTEFVGRFS